MYKLGATAGYADDINIMGRQLANYIESLRDTP
jgi:hypothetical protein